MKDILIEKYGYPTIGERPGSFTKSKQIFLDRYEMEKVVVEYNCAEEQDDKDYYIMVIHSVALRLLNRVIRIKKWKDSIKNSLDDLSQDLVIIIIKSLEKYDPYSTNFDFYGFLVYEAKNLFRDPKAIERKFYAQLDNVSCELSSKKMINIEIEDYLKSNLTDRQYSVCMLKSGMYGKFSDNDISSMLGVATITVKCDWRFCKDHLKNDLFLKEFLKGGI